VSSVRSGLQFADLREQCRDPLFGDLPAAVRPRAGARPPDCGASCVVRRGSSPPRSRTPAGAGAAHGRNAARPQHRLPRPRGSLGTSAPGSRACGEPAADHSLVAYRFFHDEAAGDGEWITLEGELAGAGLRLPQSRSWYTNTGDEYLGRDRLVKVEPLSPVRPEAAPGNSSRRRASTCSASAPTPPSGPRVRTVEWRASLAPASNVLPTARRSIHETHFLDRRERRRVLHFQRPGRRREVDGGRCRRRPLVLRPPDRTGAAAGRLASGRVLAPRDPARPDRRCFLHRPEPLGALCRV